MRSQRISHWQVRFRLLETWFRLILNWKHRPIDQIRASWAREGSKDTWLATKLFDLTRNAAANSVDDKTWIDLEFERLFSSVDSTLTRLGSQCLYQKLRIYRDDPGELASNFSAYQVLRRNIALREQLQRHLWPLRSDSEALTCETLFGDVTAYPPSMKLVLPMSAASILTFAAMVLNPALWWIFSLFGLCNVCIMVFLRHTNHETFLATGRLGRMISTAARLARVDPTATISQPARLRAIFREAGDLRRSFRWFLADRSNEIVAAGYFWLNMLFLVDHVAAALVARSLRRHRDALAQVFVQVGSLDADIAIASWLERVPAHCAPVITSEKTIEFAEGVHPLLSAPVPNSVALRDLSALVLGTNMAGKTTFIKMVGVNIILGRTLGVCFAAKAIVPRSKVLALIRAEHSVESGKSHFFAELERILSFVERAESGERGVFLIDELFHGTNTAERVAAGKAVLESIGSHAQVLVTTHDVELQQLLGSGFLTFHFVENPELREVFDYRLHPGISTSRNAIKLLEKVGFPQHIVREAQRLVNAPHGAISENDAQTCASIVMDGCSGHPTRTA
ncbi:MAG: MutS-related protein [Steroidobacteraceae bacterium]